MTILNYETRKVTTMKRKTMVTAAVLCAMACVSRLAIAEDDIGDEPINPQAGMVLSGYKTSNVVNDNWIRDSIASLPKRPAIKTVVDKAETFSLGSLGKTESNVGMWRGFMKCKKAGIYTLTLTGNRHTISFNSDSYSLRVNGKSAIAAGRGQVSADVALKAGWNKVEIVCHFGPGRRPISISYKPKDSLSDARPITPAILFHDQKPEEDW